MLPTNFLSNISDPGEEPDASSAIFVPRHMTNNLPNQSNYQSWIDPATQSIHSFNQDDADAAASDLDTIVTTSPNADAKWRHLWSKINPLKGWSANPWYKKAWILIKAPVLFALTITIPVVDEDEEEQGWCQLLHGLQMVLGGQILTLVFNGYGLEFLTFQVWQLVLIFSLLIVILLLCTSQPQKAPAYQFILAFVGFALAVAWIYVIANEIVSILKAFGVYFGLSDAILGLTVLAWGNSIGDLIADVAICKLQFPKEKKSIKILIFFKSFQQNKAIQEWDFLPALEDLYSIFCLELAFPSLWP